MREASETIARQVRTAVRDTVRARRIQGAAGGGWTEKGIDQILFRGSHDIMRPLASYPSSVVHALMPSVVRFMLQAFLEIDATEVALAGGERRTSTHCRRESVATCTTSKRAVIRPPTSRRWPSRRTPSAGSTPRCKLSLQLLHLGVEPADGVRLEGHLLDVGGRITARFEVVHVATDSLRQCVDVRRRRDPALASGKGHLGRVDLEERLQHEPDDARHERVDDRTRIGGQGPHDVVAPAEEDLVDTLLGPFTRCRALNSTRAHGFTDRVTHLAGDRLAGLAHRFSGARG